MLLVAAGPRARQPGCNYYSAVAPLVLSSNLHNIEHLLEFDPRSRARIRTPPTGRSTSGSFLPRRHRPACTGLAAEVTLTLPGVLDPRVPTLLARWNTMATNYMQLAHYAGNRLNLTGLHSNPMKTGGVWVNNMPGFEVEHETHGEGGIGFTMIEIWGPGAMCRMCRLRRGKPSRSADVWFGKSN
ncbi:hypothetical protein DFH09DRAFT_1412253 [Mycena vulgaris]|nr:hypothetical protein DFH09DRAFT_1412253 [Mycena vulgaris]